MKWLAIISLFFSSLSFSQDQINIDLLLDSIQNESASTYKVDMHIRAYFYYLKFGNYVAATEQIDAAIELSDDLNNSEKLAESYLRKAQLLSNQEKGVEAIEYFNKAVLIPDGLPAYGMFQAYNGMAIIEMVFEDHNSSLENFLRAGSYVEQASYESGKNLNYIYNNIGLAYTNIGMTDSALYYHKSCEKLRLEDGDTYGLAQTYMNLGTLHYEIGQNDSALHFFEKAREIRENFPGAPFSGIIEARLNVGRALTALGNYSKAEKLLVQGMKDAEEINHHILKGRAMEDLITVYSKTGRFKLAFEYSQQYHTYKDSAFNIQQKEEIIKLNAQRDYDEKLIKDSLLVAEQHRIDELERAKEKEVQDQKDAANFAIILGMIIAIVLMIGVIILVVRNLNNKKKANAEIQEQKEKLAEINQEVTDSILYAQRIQSSIMPSDDYASKVLGDHFIFYQPKAIVAGDFYWIHESSDRVFFTAADCTGHGVPGALVSVVCSGALTRSVEEYGLNEPGKVLDKTRELVVNAFSKYEQQVNDGMDLSLCCWLKNENKLLFSGAYNPIYIIRNKGKVGMEVAFETDTHYLIEIKGDKQPIGKSEKSQPFNTHEVQLEKGDIVFSFSDGYPDQFGGEKGKKFKYSSLKKLLLSNASLSMASQKEKLEKQLKEWMGDLEQVDDICIIGVRV